MDEWTELWVRKGFTLKEEDAAPDEKDWVGVNRLQESGPEFLDYTPRFLPPPPASDSTDFHVTEARMVAVRAEDGGYAIYRVVESTHEWTLICGYGPGGAQLALLSLALSIQLTDERAAEGLPIDEASWDAAESGKWTKSAALYNICRRIVKLSKGASRAR